jgi:hypothetical protein
MKTSIASLAFSRFLLVAFFAMIGYHTQAQNFSLKAGVNYSDVLASPEPLNVFTPKTGFHVGIVVNDLKISEKINIQPELLYSLQGFKVAGLGNIGLHYIQMPILAKLAMTDQVSILLGPQVSYLANARIGVVNDLFSLSYNGAFNKLDASMVAGAEFKVAENMTVGGRYALGLNNINKDFQLSSTSSFNDYFQLKNSGFQVYASFAFGK